MQTGSTSMHIMHTHTHKQFSSYLKEKGASPLQR